MSDDDLMHLLIGSDRAREQPVVSAAEAARLASRALVEAYVRRTGVTGSAALDTPKVYEASPRGVRHSAG